ncbi:MAG: rRNA maturation RNase YbeY [Fidelibacterota bacterium]|nr:MAG: rRNA maturation RNase YbeY [Candidatus Neomarinimicrobiota bacterium]
MITVNVDTQSDEPPPLSPEVIAGLVTATLTDHGIDTGQVQVVFTDDEYLRRLKREYFGRDEYTDVIAFKLNESDEPLDGEIYISQERARENSRLYGESYQREIKRLIVHGCLHLSGHEDDTPVKEAQMRSLEEVYLASPPQSSGR